LRESASSAQNETRFLARSFTSLMPDSPKTTRALTCIIAGIVVGLGLLLPVPTFPAAAETSDPRALLVEIQQLLEKGDYAAARERLTVALKEFPNVAAFYNFMGVVEVESGNYRAAELDFQKSVEMAPRFTGAYLNLGRFYQEHAGKIPQASQKALEAYQRLLKFEPDNVEAIYQSAFLLQLLGSFKSSLEHLARLPDQAQERSQALAVRCADYAALGERTRADLAAQELAQSADLAEADLIPLLPVLEKHHRPDLEIKLLAALAKRNPPSPSTLYKLGVLFENEEKYQQARETFEKVAQQEPNSVPLLVELARVANRQDDHKGALGYLAHARDLEPRNAAIHFFFGIVCVEENLAEEAYHSLKEAVTLDPFNAFYNYAFGAVAVQREEPSESIPYFKKYIELKPDDPRGRFLLGAAYFYSDDDEQAHKELERVANLPQTAAGAHYFLGRVANRQGQYPEAIKMLQEALKFDPQFADAYAEMGLIYLKQKQYAEAEKNLCRALNLKPESYTANLNLMILYQRTKDPRADEQAKKFQKIRAERAERSKELLRTIVIQP
jgi:tetratricopeptide (TPR) repeat protein